MIYFTDFINFTCFLIELYNFINIIVLANPALDK